MPADRAPVIAQRDSRWTAEEAALLELALYFLEESLPLDDPRRELIRRAQYVPFDLVPASEGPTPGKTQAMYSLRTGNLYLQRPTSDELPFLASSLAHELHHMERDTTETINRMHECDRERAAHARQADDVERMILLLRARSDEPDAFLPAFLLARAQARALAAMYDAKFELFRVVQALDRVDGLREMPALYERYERCIDVAGSDLSTDHAHELEVLDELKAASLGSHAEAVVAAALSRARDAVLACAPLEAAVDRLRAAANPMPGD